MLTGLAWVLFVTVVVGVFAQLQMQLEKLKTQSRVDTMQMKAEIERLTNRLRTMEKDIGRAMPLPSPAQL